MKLPLAQHTISSCILCSSSLAIIGVLIGVSRSLLAEGVAACCVPLVTSESSNSGIMLAASSSGERERQSVLLEAKMWFRTNKKYHNRVNTVIIEKDNYGATWF